MISNKVSKWAVAAVAALLSSLPMAADTIKLTGVGGNSEAGVYTMPYYLTVNGGAPITVACDDFTHDVVIGETWSGTVFSYAQLPAVLSQTRAGAPVSSGGLGLSLSQAQTDYKEIFWLYQQFLASPAPSGNTTAEHINFAIWAVFDPSLIGNTGAGWTTGTNSSAYWLAQAQAHWSTVDPTGFFIITPADLLDGAGTSPHQASSPQEYVGYTPTPEPASLALLGSGLLGLGSFIRRKLI